MRRIRVHEGAGVAFQPLGGAHPQRLDRPLHESLALRTPWDGMAGRDAQALEHAGAVIEHQVVGVAGAVVAVEHGRDARPHAGHAQGVQHGQLALGQGNGDAHATARRHVDDGREFRLERLSVERMQDFGVKGGAVRRVHVAGPQFGRVAPPVGPQLEQRIARGAPGFLCRGAHLGKRAAHCID